MESMDDSAREGDVQTGVRVPPAPQDIREINLFDYPLNKCTCFPYKEQAIEEIKKYEWGYDSELTPIPRSRIVHVPGDWTIVHTVSCPYSGIHIYGADGQYRSGSGAVK